MLSRNRTAPPEKRIEHAGLDMRDAEHERVVGGPHASVDIVAAHIVVARFARATVEQRAETFFEPELLRKNVPALSGRAVRCVLLAASRGSRSPRRRRTPECGARHPDAAARSL